MAFQKFKFIFEYMDTSEVSGKPILNVSVKEKLSTAYFRRNPHAEKEFVKGIKRAGVDEIFDEESVQRFLEDVFKEVDIFDNDIAIMQNRFVSPLSKIGSGFYKYYLSDTISRRRQMYRTQFCTVQQPHVRILRPHLRAAR